MNIIFKFCYHKSASKLKCPIIIKARQSQTEIEQGQQLIDDIMMNQLDLASLGWAINFIADTFVTLSYLGQQPSQSHSREAWGVPVLGKIITRNKETDLNHLTVASQNLNN